MDIPLLFEPYSSATLAHSDKLAAYSWRRRWERCQCWRLQ